MANISKKITEICSTGTPKQKAFLIIKSHDKSSRLKEAIVLTSDERKALRESLKTDADKKEFNKWLNYFEVLRQYYPALAISHLTFKNSVMNLLAFVQQWEDYQEEENHLNYILTELENMGDKAAVEMMRKRVVSLRLDGSRFIVGDDGYFRLQLEGLKGSLQRMSAQASYFLEETKTYLKAIEDWMKKKHCEAIMPEGMKLIIEEIKEDYGLAVAPKYSSRELRKREERGETITAAQRERALVPNYEDTKIREDLINEIEKLILDYENTI